MRSLAMFSLVILTIAVASKALAGDAETIEAINASSNALDKAFEQNDKAAIKALMTPDHISVTPYYDGPQTTDDQIASLPELKWDQRIVSNVKVSLLVTMRRCGSSPPTSKEASRASPCRPRYSRPRFW
jgi:hypothetical protein